MEKTFDKTRYRGVINIAHKFLKGFVVFVYIVLGFLLAAFLVLLFIPKASLYFDLSSISHINVNVTNILLEIDESIFEGTINLKRVLLAALSAGMVNLLFLQFVLTNLKHLVGSVKTDVPFRNANAVILRNMGFAFLIASLVIPSINGLAILTAANAIEMFQNIGYNFSFNLQYVFMGGLILILAYVFSYGSYLQEEHDTTI